MKRIKVSILLFALPLLLVAQDQTRDGQWSLSECIDYALSQNIQVRQSILTNLSNQLYLEQAEAQKLPSFSASARQNFGWSSGTDPVSGLSSFSGSSNSSFGLNSGLTVYNGNRLRNLVKQAELDVASGLYDSETIKESISLSILNAFLQVVFLEENIKNAETQLETTKEQLVLADARLETGIISSSDYLQVKSQQASEKLSLANAKSQYEIAKVNLMQMMELPLDDGFKVLRPNLESFSNADLSPESSEVYAKALEIKPQVQSAAIKKEQAAINEKIAYASYYPVISMDAGLSTTYSNMNSSAYFSQLGEQFSPTVGFSISIPIFQKKQAKTSVALAKINYQSAELQEIDTRNALRKEVEQACVDVETAQIEYEASVEKYHSTQESYVLALEKYNNGLINSVDFLFEKTNLTTAESELLQSKFNLIFSYKILDFYMGNPITL